MDRSTRLTQHIQATPEKVWSVITDIPGSAGTLSGVDSVQLLTDGPYGEGTRWKETRKMMGRSETVQMWVAKAEPDRSATVKAVQGGADYTTHFSLVPKGGGTDLTLTFGAEVLSRPSAAASSCCSSAGWAWPPPERPLRRTCQKSLPRLSLYSNHLLKPGPSACPSRSYASEASPCTIYRTNGR